MAPDEAHEARLDTEAEAAYDARRFVEHSRAGAWLMNLAEGERESVPRV